MILRSIRIEDSTNLAFNFLSPFTFQNSETPVKQEFSEVVYLVTLPILDSALKFTDGCETMFFIEGIICSMENRLSSFNALGKICLPLFI